jgi:hypothetical protein
MTSYVNTRRGTSLDEAKQDVISGRTLVSDAEA